MKELKPCPMCGAAPKLIVGFSPIGHAFVDCECGMQTALKDEADDVVAMWNRRAAPAIPQAAGDAGQAPVAQWQTKLREPILPECDVWINVNEEGAKKAREQWSHVYEVRALYAAPVAPAAAAPCAISEAELTGELWRASVERELLDMAKVGAERLNGPFQSGFLQCVEEIATRLHLSDELRNFSTQDAAAAPSGDRVLVRKGRTAKDDVYAAAQPDERAAPPHTPAWEARVLASILRGMVEGGPGDPAVIYRDDYSPADGDVYVARAAELLDDFARATAPQSVKSDERVPKLKPRLIHCAASEDGECSHAKCPQLRDGEPNKSGRHCPLDRWEE